MLDKVEVFCRGANRQVSGRDKGQSISYNKEDLAQYFHLSLTEAATQLNISPTTLKKLCRNFGIKRWPYQRRTLNYGLNPEAVGSLRSFLERKINKDLNHPSSSDKSRAATALPFNQSDDGAAFTENNGDENATLRSSMSHIDDSLRRECGILDDDFLPFSYALDEKGFLGPDQDEGVPISNSPQDLIDVSLRREFGIFDDIPCDDDVAPILIQDSDDDDDSSHGDFTFSSRDQEKKLMKNDPFAVLSSDSFDLNTAKGLKKFLDFFNRSQ